VNAELASFHAYVYGRVQGVFFRSYVASHARQLGLIGYVRNLSNGSVEVMAGGEHGQLEKLIDLIKTGPSAARVDDYKIEWSDYDEKYLEFYVF
jgi:acylphosphatase